MTLADKLWHAIAGLPDWLVVVILSAAPISEVRGGIPVGIAYYKMPLWQVFPLAVISSVLAVVWVLPTYNWMAATFDQTPVLGHIFRWTTRQAQRRKAAVDRYGFWAVTLFVAVPLPGSGCWAGSVLAAICRLSFGRFLLAMVLGSAMAATVVSALTTGGIHIFNAIHLPDQ